MNIPNKLSMLRIMLVPVIMFLLTLESPTERMWAFVVFALASITDFVDGYIARKYNMITKLGELLDPLADKVLTIAVFIQLVGNGEIPAWAVTIIVSREMIISIFRAVAASSGIVIAAGIWGKFKTVTQMIAILMLLSQNYLGELMNLRLDLIFFYVAVILTILSGVEYIYANRAVLKE